MQFFKKSSTSRFEQLKIARRFIITKDNTEKDKLRKYLDKDIILSDVPWSEDEFKLIVDILHNFDNTVPKNILSEMGNANPYSLVKILYHDVLKTGEASIINTINDPSRVLSIDEKLAKQTKTPFGVRVALVGDPNVGKRTIANKFLGRKFGKQQFSTLFHKIKIGNQVKQYTFQFRRLAPLDTYIDVRRRFYGNAMVGLIIFDISNPVSFLNAIQWLEEMWDNNNRKVMPIALIGNKNDLRSIYDVNHIPVEEETINHYLHELSKKFSFRIPYFEISAKEDKGKHTLLSYLIKVFEYQDLLHNISRSERNQDFVEDYVYQELIISNKLNPNIDVVFEYLKDNLEKIKTRFENY